MPAKQPEANVRQEPGVAVIDLSSPWTSGTIHHVFEKYWADRRFCKGS